VTLALLKETTTIMLLQFFFKRMSLSQQARYLRKKGVILGTRIKDGRRIYIYMLEDLFIEVKYLADNVDNAVEKLSIHRGLDNLNNYLEKEFKASF
jgi:hypothetical protein